MLLDRLTKQSGETLRYIIDCADWLDPGELCIGVSTTVTVLRLAEIDPPPLDDDTLEVEDAQVDEDNPQRVLLWVAKGRDSSKYKIDVQITTNDNQIREDEIIFRIKDI